MYVCVCFAGAMTMAMGMTMGMDILPAGGLEIRDRYTYISLKPKRPGGGRGEGG